MAGEFARAKDAVLRRGELGCLFMHRHDENDDAGRRSKQPRLWGVCGALWARFGQGPSKLVFAEEFLHRHLAAESL